VTVLEARALTGSRGEARLFRDVSFRLEPRKWLALRGPNGSGKTTLLRCVAGLTQADSGEVLIDGEVVARGAGSLRGALLYAGHLPALKDELSAEENLRSALCLRGVAADAAAERAALEAVGLGKRRHLPARRLSAGQRRRIVLARLMRDPAPIWALDEPLTALDDAGQALFQELLERHLERGGSALLATHQDLAPAPAHELRLG
jgi:heme exporter protein A